MPLVTVNADARPRDPLNLFDGGRNPERETLAGLTQGMERRLQDHGASRLREPALDLGQAATGLALPDLAPAHGGARRGPQTGRSAASVASMSAPCVMPVMGEPKR